MMFQSIVICIYKQLCMLGKLFKAGKAWGGGSKFEEVASGPESGPH